MVLYKKGLRLAVIPARGGSKRIPRKNIKEFCKKIIKINRKFYFFELPINLCVIYNLLYKYFICKNTAFAQFLSVAYLVLTPVNVGPL